MTLDLDAIQSILQEAWEKKESFPLQEDALLQAISQTLQGLNEGTLRVAEKINSQWVCHEWIKKAILLSFYCGHNKLFQNGPSTDQGLEAAWFDKVPLKTQGWTEREYGLAGFRSVPGSIVRHSAYIGARVVLMPSFVNVGAHIGEGTMIDTWSTIGSCAQIGAHCHISGGVGIGGVLEPVQANPVIIEDHCFIGARSEIAEGVIVETGSVISMGVFLGASTKIVHRQTGEIFYGRIPPYSVVVPGTFPSESGPHLACAVIIKQVDARTRAKTEINTLLREASLSTE